MKTMFWRSRDIRLFPLADTELSLRSNYIKTKDCSPPGAEASLWNTSNPTTTFLSRPPHHPPEGTTPRKQLLREAGISSGRFHSVKFTSPVIVRFALIKNGELRCRIPGEGRRCY
ncbi:hypothetical protein CEXT_139661 [Caerostris extrusa]|uniref:Uncharacterized protein n=1 Tax=Caerostris extrusa TaxID=172846 RepID=A0AAV4R9U9_CAEEX|nr:hypothetical protein CEXT_139661 [Caerostris extrusa]